MFLALIIVGAINVSAVMNVTNYTSNTSWTAPYSLWATYNITVEVWGAGGGGGNSGSTLAWGTGGGAGAYSYQNVTVTGGTTYNIVVGKGGVGGAGGGDVTGDNGEDSYFWNTTKVLAKGGLGGEGGKDWTQKTDAGGIGGDAASGVGTRKYSGGNGARISGPCTALQTTCYSGAGGGAAGSTGNGGNASNETAGTGTSLYGGNGGTGRTGGGSNPGSNYGGGGSGGSATDDGGDGAQGLVRISWMDYGNTFVTTWDTNNAGPVAKTIVLPLSTTLAGNYDFNISWGDGTSPQRVTTYNSVNASHTYAADGVYQVVISPSVYQQALINGWSFKSSVAATNYSERLTGVLNWGPLKLGNKGGYFYECRNLVITAADTLNLSGTTNMSESFYNARDLNGGLAGWDVSAVTDMSMMFYDALAYNEDLSSWNTGSVTTMKEMFRLAVSYNQSLDNWDIDHVTDFSGMFRRADSYDQAMTHWQPLSAINMSMMFYDAGAYNQPMPTFGNWWKVNSVQDMSYMFYQTIFDQDLSTWNTTNVKSMESMFEQASIFNAPLFTNVHNVTNFHAMFYQASLFNQDIGTWDTSKATDMGLMFADDPVFNQDLGSWDTGQVTEMTGIFNFNTDMSILNYDSLLIGWAAKSQQMNNTLSASLMKYTCAAQAAHDYLEDHYNWTIVDAGRYSLTTINIVVRDELTNLIVLNDSILVAGLNHTYNLSTLSGYITYNIAAADTEDSYYITIDSLGYSQRVYQILGKYGSCIGTWTDLNAYLLTTNATSNIVVWVINELNQPVSNSRIIISRDYGGTWFPVVDTYTDAVGKVNLNLQDGTVYMVTVIATGYSTRQFLYQFYNANNPHLFILTSTGSTPYTDLFNDVEYTYSPINTILSNTSTNFTFNVLSHGSLLQWVSINSSLNNSNISGVPNLVVTTINCNLAGQSGTYPVTYCIQEVNASKCFTINYWIETRANNTNNLLNSLNNFRNSFTGGSSGAWLTILAIFGVLAICIIISSLAMGDPIVTTIGGFAAMIFFTVIGWLSPILTGFICVIGLFIFFFNRQGGQ
jgi:surface protein